MILIVTLVILAVALLAAAWLLYRQPPTLPSRLRAVGASVAGITLLLLAAYMEPGARAREIAQEAQTQKTQLDAELSRVRALSEALGGPQAFVEYLKATARKD